MIPNTVALIANSPNPEEGKQLIDYLLSTDVEKRLAHMESAQIPLRSGIATPAHVKTIEGIRAMSVNYE